jgi:hypothetical protein
MEHRTRTARIGAPSHALSPGSYLGSYEVLARIPLTLDPKSVTVIAIG